MIDAYEIGIRLALENGVSDGIAVIQRDLATLDAAIAKSAAGLVNLQTLTAGVAAYSAPSVQTPARPLAAAPPAAEPSTNMPAPARAAAREPEPLPLPEAKPPTISGPSVTIAPIASPPTETVRERQRPAPAVVVVPAAPDTRPAAAPPPPTLALSRAVAATPPSPRPAMQLPSADQTRPASPRAPAPPASPIAQPVAPEVQLSPGANRAPTAPASNSPRPAPAAPPAPQLHAPAQSAAPVAPVLRPSVRRPTTRPAAPIAPHASSKERQSGHEGLQERQAANPKGAAESRPTEGHIYLEGAVLGRWLSDQLSRAANRPRAGSTGFDPRVSPAWPGAPIGN